MLKTLVIIPAYNEQECILNTVKEVQQACPFADLLVVNHHLLFSDLAGAGTPGGVVGLSCGF